VPVLCHTTALATGNNNAEAAMEWVFSHMEDPDFNDPLPDPDPDPVAAAAAPPAAAAAVDPEKLSMLTAMGFEVDAAEAALFATGVARQLSRSCTTQHGVRTAGLSENSDCVYVFCMVAGTSLLEPAFEPAFQLYIAELILAAAAAAAVCVTGGNVERAGDWLFSHMDDLPAAIASVKGAGAGGAAGGVAAAAAGDAAAGSRCAPRYK
jgi:hypothetical protein